MQIPWNESVCNLRNIVNGPKNNN